MARASLPDAEITVVDQGRFISYGGCGIPYYLADEVPDETQLMRTSFHALRDARRPERGVLGRAFFFQPFGELPAFRLERAVER